MKITFLNRLTVAAGISAVAFFLMTPGCDRPEVPRSEYGTVLEEFPVIPDAPKTLPLPEGVNEMAE